jgi:hypothetical protein
MFIRRLNLSGRKLRCALQKELAGTRRDDVAESGQKITNLGEFLIKEDKRGRMLPHQPGCEVHDWYVSC